MTTEALEVLHQKPFRWPSRPVLSVSTKTRRFPQEYHTSRFRGLSWSIIIFPPCFLQHCKNWWVSLSYIGFHIFPYLLNVFFPGFMVFPIQQQDFSIFSPKFHGFLTLPQAMATSYRPPRSFWGAAFDNLGQWWHLILSFPSDWWDMLNRKPILYQFF